MPELNKELIEELLKYTGRNCVITGSDSFEIVHIEHRGQGGDPSKNVIENLVPMRKDFHDLWEGRRKKPIRWNGMTIKDIKITEWQPQRGKLEVKFKVDGEWKKIDHDELWFYKRPTPDNVGDAWKHHQVVLEAKKDIGRGIIKLGVGLTPIKRNEEWRSLGYESWTDYINSPEVSIPERKANRAVKIYEGLIEGAGAEPERLMGIDQLKLEEITKVADENNKDDWLHDAEELSRDDIRRRVRDVKGESETARCSNCVRPNEFEFDQNFDKIAFGSRVFHYCPYKPTKKQGYLIETLDPGEQRNIAEECEYYEER